MSTPRVFQGNCPRNVSTDAKYRIRSDRAAGGDRTVVELVFNVADGERWYVTTRDHPNLVEQVNEVKLSLARQPKGVFYINEYKQVIVPTVTSDRYYYAGQYDRALEFEMDGKLLSGEPTDLDGIALNSADTWDGPHPGIPYVLTARGNDIKYSTWPSPNFEREVLLSEVIGPARAEMVARPIRDVKGDGGGRFYVNEFLTIFAPVLQGSDWQYVYIGQLELDEWFPKPDTQC